MLMRMITAGWILGRVKGSLAFQSSSLIVILLNIIFLSNVVYVLHSKLNPESSQQAIMKQARATTFLVPILGVNYLLVPIRPAEGSWLEDAYDFLVVVFSAFQGAFVSLLLCFTNCEVLVLIRKYNCVRGDHSRDNTMVE